MPQLAGNTMLDVDTILGIPRPTKKPSSLKKPREAPPPKYINKERALSIAKKFKITKIGKVSVRAGRSAADTVDDLPRVSLESERVLTRRILLDREKGLETAMNTKDSAVGKCILGRNDYETRRLGVAFDQLNEDVERKKYQLLRRKSLFVHKRGLTLTQSGIVFDAAASAGAPAGQHATRRESNSKPQYSNDAGIDANKMSFQTRRTRDKSPSYMRPLSCDRTRSTDSQVAEVERFLASPTMRQFTKVPDDDSTLLALQTVSEMNLHELDGHQKPNDGIDASSSARGPPRRVPQTEASSRASERKHPELPEIAESVSSSGSELDNVFNDKATSNHVKGTAANFPITAALSRSASVRQSVGTTKGEAGRRHSTAYSGLIRRSSPQTVLESSKTDSGKTNEAPYDNSTPRTMTNTRRRPSSRRRSRRKSSMLTTPSGSPSKPSGKSRRKRVSFSQNPDPVRFNLSSPSKDPRFCELTSLLIPDSAKAFDLYRKMGRLSVLDRWQEETGSNASAGLRTKTLGKIGPNRSNDSNLNAFDTMY